MKKINCKLVKRLLKTALIIGSAVILSTVLIISASASNAENLEEKQYEAAKTNTRLLASFEYSNSLKAKSIFGSSNEGAYYPEYYGGSYVDDNGDLTILLTENNQNIQNTVKNIADDNRIKFKNSKYSYAELTRLSDTISNKVQENLNNKVRSKNILDDVEGTALIDDKNIIKVFIKDINDQKIKEFKENVVDSDALVFMNSSEENVDDAGYQLSGQKISTSSGSGLSSAFRVRRATDNGFEYGFLTCGHGNKLRDSVYDNSGNLLGTVDLRKCSGNIDTSYVMLSSGSTFSNSISTTPYTLTTTNDGIVRPTSGLYVYLYGAKTHGSSGKVESTNVTFSADSVSFNGFIGSSYARESGDSGGLICCSSSSSNYTKNPVGVHKGRFAGYSVFTNACNIINYWHFNCY